MTIFFLFICLLMVSGCSGRDASKEVEYQYVRDLERGRVAVISGSTGDSDLNKKFPKMRISRYESASDMVQAIKYGRCDAIGIDTYMAGYLNAEIGGGLVPLDDAVDHLSLGAGFPLGENGELREQFNAFLRQIKLDGTHAKMVDKWVNHTMTAELTPLALPTEGEKMVVGVCSMLPPLGYSKNGELVGLEIELARYFAQYVNRPIEFLGSNQTSLFTSLVAGKTDMVLAGLSITPERKESMDFSESYLNYVETLYVLEKNKKGFNRLKGSEARYQFIQDVLDEPVGVIIGSSLEETLKRMYPQTKVKHYDSERNLVLGLRAGECQSVVIEDYALDFLDHEWGGLAALDNVLARKELGAIFRKDRNRELRKDFNAFLKEIRENGIHQRIMDKWLRNISTAELPVLDLPTSGEPIRVVTSSSVSPTAFVRNNQLVGCDIELLMYFSLYMKRPVVIEDVEFQSLISAVLNGKADMAMNGITMTKSRMKRMDFSDPYWSYNLVMAVNKVNKVGYQATDKRFLRNDTEWTTSLEERFTRSLMAEERYMLIAKGIWTTLVISFFSAILGTVLGAVVCFMRLQRRLWARALARVFVVVFKGTPLLVLLLFMFYVIFNHVNVNPLFVAVVTFALNFAAIVSTVFRVAILNIDEGQTDAAISLGFNRWSSFVNIVLPQAARVALPLYKGELVSLVKATSIVGYIALEDLTKVSDIICARTFDALIPLVLASVLYFAIAWGFTAVLDRLFKLRFSSD